MDARIELKKILDKNRYIDILDYIEEIEKKNVEALDGRFPEDSTRENIYGIKKGNIGWTTGFWTGILSLLYEYTQDKLFLNELLRLSDSFEERVGDTKRVQTHDLGFLYVLSVVPLMRLQDEKRWKKVLIEAADRLSDRFIEKAGIIQAWRKMGDPDESGRTIIDSIMNLPLLYKAWKYTGNKRYYDIAYTHAKRLKEVFVREDGSTYHTYFFDVETGEPLYPKTVQGAKDTSKWARGISWGIYGFSLSYYYTKDKEFLETAKKIADFVITHLPSDLVPFWDFIFGPEDNEEKDSSAASISAVGLLELSEYVSSKEKFYYQGIAHNILFSLIEKYINRAPEGISPILIHSVHAKPLDMGVDEGSLWGDYFFIEALVRTLKNNWIPYWKL